MDLMPIIYIFHIGCYGSGYKSCKNLLLSQSIVLVLAGHIHVKICSKIDLRMNLSDCLKSMGHFERT